LIDIDASYVCEIMSIAKGLFEKVNMKVASYF